MMLSPRRRPHISMSHRLSSWTIFFTLLTLLPLFASAQKIIEVQAPSKVYLDEPYFQVQYVVKSNDVQQFQPPTTNDFELLSQPAVSVSRSRVVINGRASENASTTYTLTYRPLRKGSFTLAGGSMTVRGKAVHTPSVKITVTGDGQPTAAGGTSRQKNSNAGTSRPGNIKDTDLSVVAALSREEVYEQEAVLLTYKFYERPGVGLSNIAMTEKPDFKGIICQEIQGKTIQANTETIRGQIFRTGTIGQYLLYAQNEGTVQVPGVTFDCTVIQQTEVEDMIDAFFNGAGNIGFHLKRTAPSLTLKVKPLPQPQPDNFSGGVGRFTVSGEMVTATPRSNDVCVYRLTVSGNGNLKMLIPPTLELPNDFDTFTPKTEEHTEITADGVRGSIVYEYSFVPRHMGRYTLPGLKFTYFDTDQKTYRTLSTDDINLDVQKGNKSDAEYERERQLQNADIHDILPLTDSSASEGFFSRHAPWSFVAAYGLLILFYLIGRVGVRHYQSAKAGTAAGRSGKASRMATKRLRAAGRLLHKPGNDEAFYAAVIHALYGFLADRFSVGLSTINRDLITRELLSQVDPEVCARFLAVLDECEMAHYAPAGTLRPKDEIYREALWLMDQI